MSFEVSIEVFEGPLDLLLQLIMRQELDIAEVPVAQITGSYLAHVEKVKQLDLETATEFLVIAATLLLIKTRSLMPALDESDELLEESETAREFLIERLVEYKKYQNAAESLATAYAEHGWYIPSMKELQSDYSSLYPDPFESSTAEDLTRTMLELLLATAVDRVDTTYIAPIRVSVAECIERVRGRLESEGEVTFTSLAEGCNSKMEVIAMFLAILELYKRGLAGLLQKKRFGEILVSRRGESSDAA